MVALGCTSLLQVRAVRASPHTVHTFRGIYNLLQPAVVGTCLHTRTPCITIWTGILFYSAGLLLFAQKTAIQWDQIPVFLCVEPQQKMAISPALAHSSFFEIGLVTAWNGVLRKQSTNGAQKRNSTPTVFPSVWSLAPWQSSAAGIRLCKALWGKAQMDSIQLVMNITEKVLENFLLP